MSRVGIAASSQIAADAGASVADEGGNAVDAAIAAALVSLCTEPGLVSPGASGFITIWPASGDPVVIDANAEMPGRGLPPERFGQGEKRIFMEYGGGMHTIIGHGSVATPGAIAGLGRASEHHGVVPWRTCVEPAIGWADRGFPLPQASDAYFAYSGEVIFGWHPDSRAALFDDSGHRYGEGEIIHVPGLAATLETIAGEGADTFYTGSIGQLIAADNQAGGGLLTLEDLAAYEAIEREPIRIEVGDWEVIANPAPAVGGAVLSAILLLLESKGFCGWGPAEVGYMIDAQHAVLGYRKAQLETASDVGAAVERLLATARVGDHRALLSSPSTIHCSAVDIDGGACSITLSAGYGSGVIAPGTGVWLNNSLGEIELLPNGFHGSPPGSRLVSNMAPTVAKRDDGAAMAIGSPGADRITTALAQALSNFMSAGMSITEAIEHPRLHVEVFGGTPTIAFEPGVHLGQVDGFELRAFPDKSMYFGGVQATLFDPRAGLFEAADSRRSGGVARGGAAPGGAP